MKFYNASYITRIERSMEQRHCMCLHMLQNRAMKHQASRCVVSGEWRLHWFALFRPGFAAYEDTLQDRRSMLRSILAADCNQFHKQQKCLSSWFCSLYILQNIKISLQSPQRISPVKPRPILTTYRATATVSTIIPPKVSIN